MRFHVSLQLGASLVRVATFRAMKIFDIFMNGSDVKVQRMICVETPLTPITLLFFLPLLVPVAVTCFHVVGQASLDWITCSAQFTNKGSFSRMGPHMDVEE